MGRARRARRIAAAAAFGGGGLGALGAAGLGLLTLEARMARRWIGTPFGKQRPDANGVYRPPIPQRGGSSRWPRSRTTRMIELGILGDSSAVGLGAEDVQATPGAVIAAGLAAVADRPVHLTVAAVVGAESRDLDSQVERWLASCAYPDVAVIMVGANDVTHRVRPVVAVRALEVAVRQLHAAGAQVVVGTCPDLGAIEPFAQPLRYLVRRWSRELAAAQTIAVVEAGGRSVSLGDLLGPEFTARPGELFSADRFHPSGAGYERAAATLLPSVCAALGLVPKGREPHHPDVRRGEGMDDVAHAAARAAAAAGTEVSGGEIEGSTRGPRGRWAVLVRRLPLPPLRGGAAATTPATARGAGPATAPATGPATARGAAPGAGPEARDASGAPPPETDRQDSPSR